MTSRQRLVAAARPVALLAVVGVLAGCQPTGGPSATGTPTGVPGDDPVGAPAVGLPANLDELLTRSRVPAEEWQDEPVLTEVEVTLAGGEWTGARLLYLAADADRFLQLTAEGSGFSVQRPTLATLQLDPVTAAAMDAVPPFPDTAMEPNDLARAAAESGCGVGTPTTVLYATGAPFAWDGTTWTEPPRWTATVTDDDGAGAVVGVDSPAQSGDCL